MLALYAKLTETMSDKGPNKKLGGATALAIVITGALMRHEITGDKFNSNITAVAFLITTVLIISLIVNIHKIKNKQA